MTDQPKLNQLATLLLGLTYREMVELSMSLAEMVKDKETRPPPEAAEDFAEMLTDWADFKLED
jgi:hypothetical protein